MAMKIGNFPKAQGMKGGGGIGQSTNRKVNTGGQKRFGMYPGKPALIGQKARYTSLLSQLSSGPQKSRGTIQPGQLGSVPGTGGQNKRTGTTPLGPSNNRPGSLASGTPATGSMSSPQSPMPMQSRVQGLKRGR